MCSIGDCFVVLPPNCAEETLIFGRNATQQETDETAVEVLFYDASEAVKGKSNGGAEPDLAGESTLRIILQKPRPGIWGGDFGANERSVCMALTWTDAAEAENGNGYLTATDIVRYTVAAADSAAAAVERTGALVAAHGAESAKINFLICDPSEVWLLSCGGKLWAAQRFTESFGRVPGNGLSVRSTIDKSSEGLGDALKTLGFWSGEGDIDFAACFGAAPCSDDAGWSGATPNGDGLYSLISMFDTLRSAGSADCARAATVSVLSATGISCHWFTATPNAIESVFKPFVFAPNSKISPLTKVPGNQSSLTLLHKLHSQRKPHAVEDLKALEASCVDEVNKYLADHPVADEELDELMKDCVEAEVKFYR